ncbi:hypothetical protein Ae168Ps1_6464c [Pseudonocardia sp. Ae168_Ps1]|nr:hypothetical protein Ae168Ps1_6464c [Pseudonocardia sp. Ae168_Ps1]OLL88962.1 hypothetical protein Ae356Ps1_6382c [Pseudonocardia sp. Ae356_Ps1]
MRGGRPRTTGLHRSLRPRTARCRGRRTCSSRLLLGLEHGERAVQTALALPRRTALHDPAPCLQQGRDLSDQRSQCHHQRRTVTSTQDDPCTGQPPRRGAQLSGRGRPPIRLHLLRGVRCPVIRPADLVLEPGAVDADPPAAAGHPPDHGDHVPGGVRDGVEQSRTVLPGGKHRGSVVHRRQRVLGRSGPFGPPHPGPLPRRRRDRRGRVRRRRPPRHQLRQRQVRGQGPAGEPHRAPVGGEVARGRVAQDRPVGAAARTHPRPPVLQLDEEALDVVSRHRRLAHLPS